MMSIWSHCPCEYHTCTSYGYRPCTQCRRVWGPRPAAAAAHPHADGRLFRNWQVHTDHLYPALLQPHAAGLQAVGPPGPMQLLDRVQHFTNKWSMELGTLVIMDDMQATHTCLVSTWWVRKTHHYDTSIIHLVQNIFDKDPSHRTINLNVTCSRTPGTCPSSPTSNYKVYTNGILMGALCPASPSPTALIDDLILLNTAQGGGTQRTAMVEQHRPHVFWTLARLKDHVDAPLATCGVPLMGQRQLLQVLRHDFDLILGMSSRRWSCTRVPCPQGGRDKVTKRLTLEQSFTFYNQFQQQVLGLTNAEKAKRRRLATATQCFKVVSLILTAWQRGMRQYCTSVVITPMTPVAKQKGWNRRALSGIAWPLPRSWGPTTIMMVRRRSPSETWWES